MKDFFMESVRLERIDLVTRSLVNDLYTEEEKEIAMVWVAEMFTAIVDEIKVQKDAKSVSGNDSQRLVKGCGKS